MFRFKEVIKEKGLKVGDIAKELGVEPSNLSNIINERNNPSIDMLERIAKVLNVEIRDLFENEGMKGYLEYRGVVHKINSISDIEFLLERIKGEND